MFFQRRHTDGQQVHEKVLITNHQGHVVKTTKITSHVSECCHR